MAENKKWVRVGTIMKNKANTGSYLKVEEGVTLTKGQFLQVQNPRKRPGITPEQLEKIPEFVVAEVYIPPTKE